MSVAVVCSTHYNQLIADRETLHSDWMFKCDCSFPPPEGVHELKVLQLCREQKVCLICVCVCVSEHEPEADRWIQESGANWMSVSSEFKGRGVAAAHGWLSVNIRTFPDCSSRSVMDFELWTGHTRSLLS